VTKAIFVLTSTAQMPETGKPTGFYFDEMAIPYWALSDAGVAIDIASITGGLPPHDANSLERGGVRIAEVQRFLDDAPSMAKLNASLPVADVVAGDYDVVFLPGGHGTMWDFAQSAALGALVGNIYDAGGIVGAVCHGPTGLLAARRADGKPLVEGLRVNGFTDAEERRVGLDAVVPYLLEAELRAQGALFEHAGEFEPYAVRDGRLVTGQNPMSSPLVAQALLEVLRETKDSVAV
jgi:putative intracellular protease/amidase